MNNELTLQLCIYYSETLEEYLNTLKSIKATRITLLLDGVQFYINNTHYEIVKDLTQSNTYNLVKLNDCREVHLVKGNLSTIASTFININ